MSADEISKELMEIFSNPRAETSEGIIAAGGAMNPELLIYSYAQGVFPWPHEGYPLLWFSPEMRGVIDFSEFRMPRSFQKWLKNQRSKYVVTMNTKFLEVIRECKVQKRKGQSGSWINKEIEINYDQLFRMGHAFSLEITRDSQLVGGIYGVNSEKYFSCESMFHKEDNTSKLALYELIQYLTGLGHTWIDIQMVTSVCESLGGKLITKDEFLQRIGV